MDMGETLTTLIAMTFGLVLAYGIFLLVRNRMKQNVHQGDGFENAKRKLDQTDRVRHGEKPGENVGKFS
jgi:uncharacterized membrane protein YdfJ with MMPL/SSD domain